MRVRFSYSQMYSEHPWRALQQCELTDAVSPHHTVLNQKAVRRLIQVFLFFFAKALRVKMGVSAAILKESVCHTGGNELR